MNGDNFDDTSKPTSPRSAAPGEPHFVLSKAMMGFDQKREYDAYLASLAKKISDIVGQQDSESPKMVTLNVNNDTGHDINVKFDDQLYLCSKCQKKSHYDPKEFHGLCPACWAAIGSNGRWGILGIDYDSCRGGCGWVSVDKFGIDGYGYCQQCWTKLTPDQRSILRGKEPPPPLPPQETRIVHLPAVPSLWKVFAVSIMATVCALAVFSAIGYALVFHLHL